MGKFTEIMAAVNTEVPLDQEHFFYLDVENPTVRKEILEIRKTFRKNKNKLPSLFD